MDIKTLYVVLGITDTLQAIAFFLQYLINKKQKGVVQWAIGFSLVAFGFLLILLRTHLNNSLLTIILANFLLNMGAIFIYIGIMRFLDSKENRAIIYSLMSIFVVTFIFFTYIKDDINVRTMITSCLVAFISWLTAVGLFTKKSKEIRYTANFLGTVFLLHGIFYLSRTIINLTVSPVHALFSSTTIQVYTFLVQITEGILITVGLIIMVNQKSYSDLEEAKEHFELIFSTTPDAVLISSITDGKIIEINDAFTQLTGYSREELIGNSTLATNIWKNPEDRQKVVQALQKEGHCENRQAIYLRKDGGEIFGSLSAKFITLKGAPYIFSITRDITNLKQTTDELREIDEKYRLLYESAGIGIGYYKIDCTVISYNRLAAKNMGGTPEDFNGKSIYDLFPEQEAALYHGRIKEATASNQSLVFEDKVILPIGEVFFLSTFTKIEDDMGALVGIQIISQDITDRKLAEEEIKNLNATLEQKVQQRTRDLEVSNQELEAFAYSVAHDLRSPLRAIDGFSQMLFDEYQPKLDKEAIRKLTIIRSNTHKMDHLILDLLAMAKVTRTVLSKEKLDMNQLLHSILQDLAYTIQQENIELIKEDLPFSFGDASLIRIVWTNLLENAIKFIKSKEVRKITIQGYQEGGYSIYKITDTGIGFNPAFSSKLFRPFHTLHSPDEISNNTGIGLALVERIIQRHNGKVWADGIEGEGAVFYFSLPMAKQEENYGH